MKGIDFNCQFPAFFLNTEPLQKEKKKLTMKIPHVARITS